MGRVILLILFSVWGALLLPFSGPRASDTADPVSLAIRRKLAFPGWPERVLCRKELLCGPDVISGFYLERDFQPAWSDRKGLLRPAGGPPPIGLC